jgi:copper resistance protein C
MTMRIRILLTSLLLATFSNGVADAHAFLDHASPLVGSTVASAPHEVALTFTQNLESSFSSVQVTDANDARVDQGKAQIEIAIARHLRGALACAVGRHA